jgi:cyclopropane-fatty-acyl-phospholipid synthase
VKRVELDAASVGASSADLPLVDRVARRIVLQRLAGLGAGELTIDDVFGRHVFGGAEPGPSAVVRVHRPGFFRSLALGGGIGAAESFMRGDWSTDDLTTLLRLMVLNRRAAERLEGPLAPLVNRLTGLVHAASNTTMRGARKHIAAHYDLGNELFQLFLDPTLCYSCALFARDDMSLAEASRAKLDRICRKLQLSPRDHLLDVGCGWGGLALHAAREFGCRVTAITISRAQHAFASRRIADAGLTDRVAVRLQDYRTLPGRFDKITSIEMIEAIRPAQYRTFFQRCRELLAPDGLMLLQAIVIEDRDFESARRSVDFIKRYIFPGGCLPSVSALSAAAARASDLRLVHLEDWTPHYPPTLRHWRANLQANIGAARALGYSEPFLRMWEYYFAYCEAGFLERHTGDVQMMFAAPGCRVDPVAVGRA